MPRLYSVWSTLVEVGRSGVDWVVDWCLHIPSGRSKSSWWVGWGSENSFLFTNNDIRWLHDFNKQFVIITPWSFGHFPIYSLKESQWMDHLPSRFQTWFTQIEVLDGVHVFWALSFFGESYTFQGVLEVRGSVSGTQGWTPERIHQVRRPGTKEIEILPVLFINKIVLRTIVGYSMDYTFVKCLPIRLRLTQLLVRVVGEMGTVISWWVP